MVAAGSVINERISEVRSVEDISSGYSSSEGLYAAHQPLKLQGRDSIASQRTNSLTRTRSTRVTRSGAPKKSGVASDDSDENEVFDTNIIFLNDKAKKIDKLIEKHESSSSEAEFFDIPENNGFQLHDSERSSSNNTKVELVKYNPQYGSASANLRDLRYDNDVKITACNSDLIFPPPSSSLLNFNLSKLSAALSLLYYSSLAPPHIEDANTKTNQSENNANETEALDAYKEPEPCDNTFQTTNPPTPTKSDERGGKYNKKLAPLPPIPRKKESHTANPIKAKLVLQPGVVRSLSASAESLNKEIFVNYPAKIKRKTPGNAQNKAESPLLKMLRLPKKMAHLNIPGRVKEKRHSWGEFFHTKRLVDGKIQSKSASNLDVIAKAEVAKPFQRSGSQISIRSLTESPLAHRRLKVVRTCAADKDTD